MRYFLFTITFLSLLSCSVDELFGGKDPLIGEWEFNYDDSQCGLITVSKNGEIIITANGCDNSGGGQVFFTNDDGTTSTTTLQPEPDVINNGSWVNNSENANFDDSTQYSYN